ncbi:g1209 [Coccomyxa elongata]
MLAFVARAVGVRDGARVALPPSGALGWTTRLRLVSKFVGATHLQPRGASVLSRVDSLPAVARPGDHIAVLGPSAPVWHHGILADSSHVFDLYGACKQSAVVSRRSIPDFLQGVTAAAIVHYPDDDDGFRLLTLSLAEAYSTSKLNRKGQYDAVRRNCESFATWCRSTQWASHQSQIMQSCALARSMGMWITLLHMLNALASSA